MDLESSATIPFDADASEHMMDEWTWLVGENKQIVLVSAIGDVFVAGEDGKIFWLDTGLGKFEQVAESLQEFIRKLSDHDQADTWLLTDLIEGLRVSGKLLGVGQVYSYIKSPIMGGEYVVQNFIPLDFGAHLNFTGQLHRQISALPDGARVRIGFEDRSLK